jgi:hypothetical protein
MVAMLSLGFTFAAVPLKVIELQQQVRSQVEGFDSLVAIQPSNKGVDVSRTGTTDGSKFFIVEWIGYLCGSRLR